MHAACLHVHNNLHYNDQVEAYEYEDFIEVVDGVEVQKCDKMNAMNFDKLNPCKYIQVYSYACLQ